MGRAPETMMPFGRASDDLYRTTQPIDRQRGPNRGSDSPGDVTELTPGWHSDRARLDPLRHWQGRMALETARTATAIRWSWAADTRGEGESPPSEAVDREDGPRPRLGPAAAGPSAANRRGLSGRSVQTGTPAGRPGRPGAASLRRGAARAGRNRAGSRCEPVVNDAGPVGRRATAGTGRAGRSPATIEPKGGLGADSRLPTSSHPSGSVADARSSALIATEGRAARFPAALRKSSA